MIIFLSIFQAFFRNKRRRERKLDRELLFSEIRNRASNKSEADRAILHHIMIDSAWRYPEEWKEEGIE